MKLLKNEKGLKTMFSKKILLLTILSMLLLTSFAYADTTSSCKGYDFNCDGVTTSSDLDIVSKYFHSWLY